MHGYVLTWNPNRWDWPYEYRALIQEAIRLVERQEKTWSCAQNGRIVEGDRLFLLKQGVEPRGIMASGYATSDVYEDDHWDSDVEGTTRFVKLYFDRMVDEDLVLSVDVLQADPIVKRVWWRPFASGMAINQRALDRLEELWDAFAQSA